MINRWSIIPSVLMLAGIREILIISTPFDLPMSCHPGRRIGKYVATDLTGDNHRQFFLPRGMAHGFVVLSEEVVFQYKCDNLYHPEAEGAIAWNDPDLNIDWHIPTGDIILSEKDKHHACLKDSLLLFDYREKQY